ncbi:MULTISPECIES: DUF1643 domain-containing protein [Mycobacterium]|uniref:DUF1643 domain-containing protein n=4 Tax=Mycobacterium TaxID=1763 RepID=A0AAW5RZF9_MYCBC|nr:MULTISPECIES: DUF1643 domain-containing protein [Mycobacterium avium complex (MAC)]ORV96046.1 hypothetical protein AWC14_17255 [Mycobacterium kyorinense]MCV6987744.1 DUF1643 domain-containing protein [Mycobacterium bouchedurhonense]MCV6996935.1 DUF1643 domain-containing protein [Mycobacterium timonense]MDV3306447.1 DUF1643 domain-containing protein [Mycobacterium avium subsp. hominissuis]ORA43018.1 hypothetical protein BST19_23680 [Mycobacterium bouchedurhonense]
MTLTLDLHLPHPHLPRPRYHHYLRSSAIFSDDNRYRYRLQRIWDDAMPLVGVVMLNPSTADEHTDDATIRRVVGFAERFGYGGIDVCNLYGLRSRDPQMLCGHVDPVGADNDAHLMRLSRQRDLIVLAWGGNADHQRAAHVTRLLMRGCASHGASLAVLSWTQGGQPGHPLYLPKSTALQCLTFDRSGRLPELTDRRWAELMMASAA